MISSHTAAEVVLIINGIHLIVSLTGGGRAFFMRRRGGGFLLFVVVEGDGADI